MYTYIEIERKSADTHRSLRRHGFSFLGLEIARSTSSDRATAQIEAVAAATLRWIDSHCTHRHLTRCSRTPISRFPTQCTEFVSFFAITIISMQIHAFTTLSQCKRRCVILWLSPFMLPFAWCYSAARWLPAFAAMCSCHILCFEWWQRRWRTSVHTIEIKLQKNRSTK